MSVAMCVPILGVPGSCPCPPRKTCACNGSHSCDSVDWLLTRKKGFLFGDNSVCVSKKGDDLVLRTGPRGNLLDPLAPNILL